MWTEISVAGVAARGSRPHLGVDAIMKTGHAREEWVSLPGTVACARALTAAALDFCGG